MGAAAGKEKALNTKVIEVAPSPSKEEQKVAEGYKDLEFDAKVESITSSVESAEQIKQSGVVWKRLREFVQKPVLFDENDSDANIIVGRANNIWLMCALGVVGLNNDLKRRLLPQLSVPEDGKILCRLFNCGTWSEVVLDDRFPVADNTPLFSRNEDPNKTWVMIMEKAFAKIFGTYGETGRGSILDALIALTGGMGFGFALGPEHEKVADGTFVDDLTRYLSEGGVVLAGEAKKPAFGTKGLHFDYWYQLLAVKEYNKKKLLKMRCSIEPAGWKGSWSNTGKSWTEEAKKALEYNCDDNRIFWMEYTTFIKYFKQIRVLFVKDATSTEVNHSIADTWDVRVGTNGGTEPFTWYKNPQYMLTVESSSRVKLYLEAEDVRWKKASTTEQIPVQLQVYRKKLTTSHKRIYLASTMKPIIFANAMRNAFCELQLEPDFTYVLVPCLMHPGVSMRYRMSIDCDGSYSLGAVEDYFSVEVEGEWNHQKAGGTYLNTNWHKHPQYLLQFEEEMVDISILLFQDKERASKQENEKCAIHVAVILSSLDKITAKEDVSQLIASEYFETSCIVYNNLKFPNNKHFKYIILPTVGRVFQEQGLAFYKLVVYSNNGEKIRLKRIQ